MSKTIGIIGCGAIGTTLAKYISKNLNEKVDKIILFDADEDRMISLLDSVSGSFVADSMLTLIKESDLVIEAAASKAVPDILDGVLRFEKDLLMVSIGGLLGNEDLLERARGKGVRIMLPSGAIAGIDAIKAANVAGINSLTITTRKPPKSLKGAQYLDEKGMDIEKIEGETVIFEGSAKEAVKHFPKNINVSAMLSLAGIGPEKTMVKILSSPDFTSNSHEIEVKGESGTIITRTVNKPFPENPKTSYLAALSSIATVKEYFDVVKIGT